MTPSKAVRLLALHAPAVFAAAPLRRERCILAAAVAIDALAAVGVEAEPRPVNVMVMNEPWRLWIDAGCPGDPADLCGDEGDAFRMQRPPGGWCVGIDDSCTPPPLPDGRPGWNGHLVAYVPRLELAVDPDFQQFSRPQRGMPCPPTWVLRWPAGKPSITTQAELRDGEHAVALITAHYVHRPHNQAFREGRDWTDATRRASLTRALVRAMRGKPQTGAITL